MALAISIKSWTRQVLPEKIDRGRVL